MGEKLVVCINYKSGFQTIEQAEKYFNCKVREITKKEFDELTEKYSA